MKVLGYVVAEQDLKGDWWVTSEHSRWIIAARSRGTVLPRGDQPVCALVPVADLDVEQAVERAAVHWFAERDCEVMSSEGAVRDWGALPEADRQWWADRVRPIVLAALGVTP